MMTRTRPWATPDASSASIITYHHDPRGTGHRSTVLQAPYVTIIILKLRPRQPSRPVCQPRSDPPARTATERRPSAERRRPRSWRHQRRLRGVTSTAEPTVMTGPRSGAAGPGRAGPCHPSCDRRRGPVRAGDVDWRPGRLPAHRGRADGSGRLGMRACGRQRRRRGGGASESSRD